MSGWFTGRWTAWVLMGLLAMSTGGCLAAGVVAYAASGPPKVEAAYRPTTRPTAVLVEHTSTRGAPGGVRDLVASFLVAELREHKVAPIVDFHRVYDLRQLDPRAFRAMTVDEIGRRVGAEQVIYVEIFEADFVPALSGALVKAAMSVGVRVVDVETGELMWPTSMEEGHRLVIESPYHERTTTLSPDEVKEQTCRLAARQIARLFYSYYIH